MPPYRRLLLFALVSLIAMSGCASIGVRTGAYSERAPIYPATAVNVGLVTYVVSEPFVGQRDHDAQEGLVYLFFPLAIVDIPFGFALDTLLLPLDIYELLRTKPVESPPETLMMSGEQMTGAGKAATRRGGQ